jgi:subtilisin-like proprotein convertase family protein
MPIIGTSATGAWVLNASDTVSSDSGTINGYTLSLCVTP